MALRKLASGENESIMQKIETLRTLHFVAITKEVESYDYEWDQLSIKLDMAINKFEQINEGHLGRKEEEIPVS